MKRFSQKRRVLAALLGGKIDRIPVMVAGCAGTVCVDMQKAVGIYWPAAHKDSAKMAKLALASCELTGLECVRVPFDFVEEPEALGCEIKWYNEPKGVPVVDGHPYKNPEDLKIPENFLERARIPVVLEALRIIRKEVGDLLPISSLVLGPFSLAGELAGTGKFMRWIVRQPDYVKEFVNFTMDIVIEYAKAQYRAGSDIVQVAEPMASEDMISLGMFREFVKPALVRIADCLGGIRVLHICGQTEKIIPDMAETGFDGISIEKVVNVARIKPLIGDTKILGNISSTALAISSPEKVKAEAREAIEAGVDLLGPGCGISPIAPLENIKAMVEAAKEFGSKR